MFLLVAQKFVNTTQNLMSQLHSEHENGFHSRCVSSLDRNFNFWKTIVLHLEHDNGFLGLASADESANLILKYTFGIKG